MRRGLAVASLLLAPLLAGCLTSAEAGLTAKDAAARTLDRARQWQRDAELYGLGGFELRNQSLPGQGPFGFLIARDPGPVDGRAPVWFVGYGSRGANASLVLLVYANGTILALDEDDDLDEDAVPLRNWEVDSPQVIEVLRGHADVGPLLQAPDASTGLFLQMPESAVSDPIWNFFAHAGSLGKVAQGAVGARAGDVVAALVENVSGDVSFEAPPPVTYQFEGSVTTAEPEAAHPFEVARGHSQVTYEFRAGGALATDGGTFEIRDPEGEAVVEEGFTYMAQHSGSENARRTGAYAAVVTYEGRVPALPAGVQETSYRMTIIVS